MFAQIEFPFACFTKTCGCLSHNGFLTRAGYRALDGADQVPYIDKVGSVSALVEVEVDMDYDATHIELNT